MKIVYIITDCYMILFQNYIKINCIFFYWHGFDTSKKLEFKINLSRAANLGIYFYNCFAYFCTIVVKI